jgi:hypothetical protein
MPPTKKDMAKQKYRFSFRRKVSRILKRAWNQEKYCVTCGKVIKREDKNEKDNIKSNDIWNKNKKCLKCLKKEREYFKGQEEKYCNFCGNLFYEFDESTKEKDWNSWYLCLKCKKIKLDITREIEISCLELADRAYKEFLQERFFVKKIRKCKELPKRFKEIVPEIIEILEDFFREASQIDNFDKKYQRLKIFFYRTVEEELLSLLSSLEDQKKRIIFKSPT